MANFGTLYKCSIPTLRRNGLQDGGTYGLVDNLTYTYDGNQLTKISDSAADPSYVGAFNFRDGADSSAEYTYDANGSMTSDKNRGITSVTYNVINQPERITFSDGSATEYVYGYDGTKLQTVHKTRLPQSSTTTTYSKNLIYEAGVLKRMLVDGGYVTFSGGTPEYHFFIQDHLGNNRIVATADGTVEQENHYYPYGGLMADICTGSDTQPYKYNGKELDRMHGLDTYDYGARQHDAATGRWDRMDPLAKENPEVSPYVYCLNNPMRYIDLKGLAPGDFFLTVDAAAIDFGMYYNDNSIRDKKEYGSSIIMVVNSKGQKGYTYTVANRGKGGEVTCSEAPWGYTPIAEIHTHGHCTINEPDHCYDNDFSGMPRDNEHNIDNNKNLQDVRNDMDIGNANERQRDSYLVTPNGSLKKYSPKTGKVTLISRYMPSDPHDPTRVNANSAYIELNPINRMEEFKQLLKILNYHK